MKDILKIYSNGTTYHRSEGSEIRDMGIPENEEPVKVIEGKKNISRYDWCNNWKNLEEKEQETIWAVFGKDSLREMFKNNIEDLKSPNRLYNSALVYFYKIGFNKECTRCGGSGRYSWNYRDGDKCFKCNGRKLQTVNPTKAQIRRFLKKYPEGLKYSEEAKRTVRGKGKILA